MLMDLSEFRGLMAGVPAPVTVVTTRWNGQPFGATVSSFASLSLDPPLISIGLIEGSTLLGVIRKAGRFAVNLLGHRQTDVALSFASRARDRFENVSWVWRSGLPHVIGAASFVACDLHQEVQGGDHALLFGLAQSAHVTDEPPLVYTARAFGTHSTLISDRQPTIGDTITACAS
jgi:flavin reductase (DIM6/NTAB) family NADH-FMN oxidoreductase RutF